MSNSQLKAFDEWLFEYCSVENKIYVRKMEIQGGPCKVTDDIIIKWDRDGRIKSYRNFKECVERLKDILDDELNTVFDLRWGRGSCRTWEEIAGELHVSIKSIYRKRERILTLFAMEIGRI